MEPDEIIEMFGDRGKVMIPFLHAKMCGMTPGDLLVELKRRGWNEAKTQVDGKTYVGWKNGSDIR
ncbi:MAG: hypothetical protein M0R06_00750 [Sphaerochaeta sp.]|jgi:hypothetical protein|nr:hypothetical protein [Sphaerochaeta sp.]